MTNGMIEGIIKMTFGKYAKYVEIVTNNRFDILKVLLNGRLSISDIQRELPKKLSYKAVYFNLTELENNGLIKRENPELKKGKKAFYNLTSVGRDFMEFLKKKESE